MTIDTSKRFLLPDTATVSVLSANEPRRMDITFSEVENDKDKAYTFARLMHTAICGGGTIQYSNRTGRITEPVNQKTYELHIRAHMRPITDIICQFFVDGSFL